MLKMISIFFGVMLVSSSIANTPDNNIVTALNFDQVQDQINQFVGSKKTEQTLLVFDLDDTLLTMPADNPLGGVGWWNWQTHMLSYDHTNPALVAHNFSSLLKDQYYLFSKESMIPTDVCTLRSRSKSIIPQVLRNWYLKDGYKIIVATARGPGASKATLHALKDNNFNYKNQLIFNRSGLKLKSHASMHQAVNLCKQKPGRDVAYQDGVLFLSGSNKGLAIQCLLKHSQWQPKNIIFIDDTLKNDIAFATAYKGIKNKNVLVIHYVQENKKEKNFITDKRLQAQCTQQWTKLTREHLSIV